MLDSFTRSLKVSEYFSVLEQVYNRTSMQHSTLSINGHTNPVERLRYMDRYLVSGGRDSTVKIWSL